MDIDIAFDFHTDSNGGDPDIVSPTLKKYHKFLWNKPLPNGNIFELAQKSGAYLSYKSDSEVFFSWK